MSQTDVYELVTILLATTGAPAFLDDEDGGDAGTLQNMATRLNYHCIYMLDFQRIYTSISPHLFKHVDQ